MGEFNRFLSTPLIPVLNRQTYNSRSRSHYNRLILLRYNIIVLISSLQVKYSVLLVDAKLPCGWLHHVGVLSGAYNSELHFDRRIRLQFLHNVAYIM
jgi:hypothetical protein